MDLEKKRKSRQFIDSLVSDLPSAREQKSSPALLIFHAQRESFLQVIKPNFSIVLFSKEN